ncbi:MAG: PadR family transcriptional regulator [Gemmatimonadota bacterium]
MTTNPPSRAELLQGTLDMLILRTLNAQSMHGYGISQHIEKISQEVLRVEQGSLYPALERLQQKGWVTSRWATTPTNRKARYYTITASGRKHLGEKSAAYDRVALAIARVMAQ